MGFVFGTMMERSVLQVVIKAYIDLIGRNSQVERRISGARDARVGREF